VTLASVTGDIISIRARRQGARIHFRIVNEYDDETVYYCEPQNSARPLTMGELVDLIDNARGEGMYPDDGTGLTAAWRDFHVANGSSPPEDMVDFVRVSSEFYPDLHHYSQAEAAAWLQERLAAFEVEDGDDEYDADQSDD